MAIWSLYRITATVWVHNRRVEPMTPSQKLDEKWVTIETPDTAMDRILRVMPSLILLILTLIPILRVTLILSLTLIPIPVPRVIIISRTTTTAVVRDTAIDHLASYLIVRGITVRSVIVVVILTAT